MNEVPSLCYLFPRTGGIAAVTSEKNEDHAYYSVVGYILSLSLFCSSPQPHQVFIFVFLPLATIVAVIRAK